ncbi:PREDICTED: craniofacial development protein 1 [Vollenhovia emeryi]|uniref:craniofacial development protein 1 n=1 Tax=Vollenhovia emeryi TaxID=411798 RepID=UPI0005F58ACC|nr:PREDICTED: craniofacial development protein 1 [Vollenhovia emeryi]XP_011868517.1 PREDICTED: craniofacial development protein 1 [Vollenhovia emeryi]XP_011868518.1 PREDICTED: craniofacial development protein 1 [Vollenhovia emeryi]
MSEEHQLPSDSDEDDEDYVPDGADSDPVSEVESEGDIESGPEDENDENKRETGRKRGTRRSKGRRSKKRRKALEKSKVPEEGSKEEEECKEQKALTEEEEKKRADSLWADFMKDTAVPKSKPQNSISKSNERLPPIQKPKVQEKVKITKVFEFAGEEVKVEKEVPSDSAEARLSLSAAENSTAKPPASASPAARERERGGGVRRVGLGGISSVLGQIGKKAKISTLEKSKLDWDSFKKQENIEEELNTHNKGKDGYLERQDFLQRADLRQFEIEKQLRNTSRRSTR